MRRMHWAVGGVLVVALAFAGCGGSKKVSPNWDPKALAALQAKAKELTAKFPNGCKDFTPLRRTTYVSSSKQIGTPVPRAVGQCSMLDEDIELSAFADVKHRDDFVASRGRVLCIRAARAKTDLPGIRWVVGDDVTLQPDSEGVARRVAEALGYKYVLSECHANADWKPADVTHAESLASSLDKAGLGCADFQLLDHDLLSHNPHYLKVGLPGAYGKCTAAKDPNTLLATFSKGTTPIAALLKAELTDVCTQAHTAKAVRGNDWYVIQQKPAGIDRIASVLGGRAAGGCSG